MKKLFQLFSIGLILITITACAPTLHSMGTASIPVPVTHRATSDSTTVDEKEVTASGFWAHNWDADNIKDMSAGGGNVGFTYRLGKVIFVNVTVGGFGGSLKFSCDDEENCNDKVTFTNDDGKNVYSINGSDSYNEWLKTAAGRQSYGFWNLQERLLLGFDDNVGKILIIGIAGGIQAYQGDSDYDEIREELGSAGYIYDADSKNSFGMISAWWVGVRFGNKGKYGNFTIEFDNMYKGGIDDWTSARKYTYAHPTGFYGGVTEGDLISFGVFAGKQFVF